MALSQYSNLVGLDLADVEYVERFFFSGFLLRTKNLFLFKVITLHFSKTVQAMFSVDPPFGPSTLKPATDQVCKKGKATKKNFFL